MRGSLLNVENLRVVFYTYRGVIKALNGVRLWLNEEERLAVVGETGCGKSVTALSIMRLIEPPGEITSGKVEFLGEDLLSLPEEEMEKVRGKSISMIFQEPVAALNPVFKVGFQIAEAIAHSQNIPIKDAYQLVPEALTMVGLDWKRTMNLYAHELSGGMAQRVMIAMALAVKPKLLIADEPTSALDVTIQAQILELLDNLVRVGKNAVIFITHDLAVASEFCDRVAVMYAGNVVEVAKSDEIFARPLHPYTVGLIDSIPLVGQRKELKGIAGVVPDLVDPPSGCRFHPRCQKAFERCKVELPDLIEVSENHFVACHLYAAGDQNGSVAES
ncbi:peptide ABC transporter ATP-binding protein [Pseudothermotoga hypogea DSM 11164 = NBRC 106472]|uniref:Peptide ABC transporter ATP-binding protein n=2 Tax=Pseudothermotoga hypogea TaxID=57487 RepID=A0A0X1KPP3_9THEM|nr:MULTISPECIES: ABC transporter ATP-binding protein [Pseudothermotoga]AJC73223.1 peptide ABC transporter ATP-binding protein [Pseudothermotoga hypogea DSM 11164 = NBRC 106472]MBC7122350.1 ABC transporter ATP-binding protein [Pseudothermotoga sp.]MDI6863354.1 ABC transporter ATP-binding protein [Pseudothermotoga sp.]